MGIGNVGGTGRLGITRNTGVGPYRVTGLPIWSAAMRARQAGTDDAVVLTIGDSTTRGVGGGATSTDPAQYLNSWPRKIAARLPAVNGVCDNFIGRANTLSQYDSRINPGGWTDVSNTLGGSGFVAFSAVSDVVFAPTGAFSAFDVYYIGTPGGGSFSVNVGGGTSLGTISCNKAAGLYKQRFTTPLAVSDVRAHWVSANAYLVGFDCWDASSKVTRFIDAGRPGWKTSDWLDASNGWSPFNALGAPLAHLISIDLGINDAINGVAPATTQANIVSLYNKAVATGADVAIITPGPVSGVSGWINTVNAVRAAATAVSAKLLDFSAYVGDSTAGMPIGGMFDSLHPTAVGYDFKAAWMAAQLRLG